ncbi:MAG: hypothetical protein Q8R76_02360 [Candidatus Omnitrophota bacterium]|nr:hypothetical protein [Candidatus Omnitrophota bacterium]
MTRRWYLIPLCLILFASCASNPDIGMTAYDIYELRVAELQAAVESQKMTTAQAEIERRAAYNEYLQGVKDYTIQREGTRNW